LDGEEFVMRRFSSAAFGLLVGLLPAMAFARIDNFQVPEPSSMALILAGLGGLAIARYRKKR
jgi:hypothetical protein